jgi:hypothetical protein
MNDDILEMARLCYGYGRWDAPYWFIGPEQGQDKEENDDLIRRAKTWHRLGACELCDCGKFHELIGVTKWHQTPPPLQPTWRPLMLLLMSLLNKKSDKDALRDYQRERWGMLNGETCVIELSGLPANNFKVPRDREQFLRERMVVIRERIRTYRPALVVVYGKGQRKQWEIITGCSFQEDNIQKRGSTIFAFTPHPSHGPGNDYWLELGTRLRAKYPELTRTHLH